MIKIQWSTTGAQPLPSHALVKVNCTQCSSTIFCTMYSLMKELPSRRWISDANVPSPPPLWSSLIMFTTRERHTFFSSGPSNSEVGWEKDGHPFKYDRVTQGASRRNREQPQSGKQTSHVIAMMPRYTVHRWCAVKESLDIDRGLVDFQKSFGSQLWL